MHRRLGMLHIHGACDLRIGRASWWIPRETVQRQAWTFCAVGDAKDSSTVICIQGLPSNQAFALRLAQCPSAAGLALPTRLISACEALPRYEQSRCRHIRLTCSDGRWRTGSLQSRMLSRDLICWTPMLVRCWARFCCCRGVRSR